MKAARFLVEQPSQLDLELLKSRYQYIYIMTYAAHDFPGFRATEKKTPIIDLTRHSNEIFQHFNAATRNQIRKLDGVDGWEFKVPDADSKASYAFYKRSKNKDGVVTELGREFRDCAFFSAYYQNELLVSISCYDTGKLLRVKTITNIRKELGEDSKLVGYATRRLVWDICRMGTAQGYEKLDLGIVNLTDPSKAGITRFKMGFGGEIVDTYIYQYETALFRSLRNLCHRLHLFEVH